MPEGIPMARPSVADARREQIIEATLQTIAEHGISGTTLDRIATTAGMSRGHVRHFVGNRDALLVDAARAFYERDHDGVSILPPTVDSTNDVLDYLFSPDFVASTAENAIVLGFVELSRSTPEIAQILTEAYLGAETRLSQILATEYPNADPVSRDEAAVAVLTSALGLVFLEDFSRDPSRPLHARRAVEALLATL